MTLAHRIAPGTSVRLRDLDPDDQGPFSGKDDPDLQRTLAHDIARLGALQELLYAEKRESVLVVLQAVDTAGKDGVLHHVVGPLDSRGVQVHSFKAPSTEERDHDFLWRVHQKTPRRGDMTFFNRSHYEDVLAVRVLKLAPKNVWKRRFDHINHFEQMLHDEGIRVVKLFLHISRDEQKRRLQARLDDPAKRWKWAPSDLEMRQHWDEFEEAYEEVFMRTSTPNAPWYVVPANRKWFRDAAVARVLVQLLEDIAPKAPHVDLDVSAISIPD